MKAMVLREKGAPFSFEDVPDPASGVGEAVTRVITCGAGLTIHHASAERTGPRARKPAGGGSRGKSANAQRREASPAARRL